MFRLTTVRIAVISSSLISVIAGCSAQSTSELPAFSYTPPPNVTAINRTRIVPAAYETVWAALLESVSAHGFVVTRAEKASGRITASFSGPTISRYVDCGAWKEDDREVRYADRKLGFSLHGKMQVRLKPIDNYSTQVRISTCYSLWEEIGNEYLFQTNDSATVRVDHPAPGTMPTRTCQPTHTAEQTILNALDAIASDRPSLVDINKKGPYRGSGMGHDGVAGRR